MKVAYRILGALLLAGFMAGCATTGEQESAMSWMQNQDEMVTPGE